MPDDFTARLERLGMALEDCDANYGALLSRLEASLELINLELHLDGLGTRQLRELTHQYRRWYRAIRSHFASNPTSQDHYVIGLLEDTEDGVSVLKSEWQRIVAIAEQLYPDPEDWDSETLIDGISGRESPERNNSLEGDYHPRPEGIADDGGSSEGLDEDTDVDSTFFSFEA